MIAEIGAATCASCAHYDRQRGLCSGFERPAATEPHCPACARYLATNGSSLVAGHSSNTRVPPEAYRGDTRAAVRQLLAQGHSAQRIAEMIGKSRQLVNYHIRQIRKEARALADGRDVVMRLAAPVDARRLARMLDAAVEAWGEVEVEPGPGEIALVRPANSKAEGARDERAA